jgi:hypothetical protein
MDALLGTLWALGVFALWIVLSGVAVILWRCLGEPLWSAVTETWARQEWPWWI